ncbi:MAG: glycine zipper 2TM domain-containing protein [Parachlamydiaceae bacterium]|nr:glycine zipper 2TM domain-containing protein [Parachlamydiaceae bacterium]
MKLSKIARTSLLLITVCSTVGLFTGCARQISSHVYSEDCVFEASEAYQGIIVSVRQVRIQNSEKLEENTAGMVAGGVTGAVIGNQIGRGSGNGIATVAGALLGFAVGASIEKDLSSQNAYEYVVQLSNGELRVVIQGMDVLFNPGQPVLMIVGYQGRPRLIPDNSVVNY